jgi:hypothetical protein
MSIDFSKFTASNIAAWWGAIIATLTLIWNIIVAIRSGARIKVTATPNVKVYPIQPITENKTYISVKAVNHGTSPTTITHFSGYYAKDLWSLVIGKKQFFVINTHPNLGKSVPYVLGPGEEWSSLADQKDITEKSDGGYLYMGVRHNQSNRPIYKRLKINA